MYMRYIKIAFAPIPADIGDKMNGNVERCGYEVRGELYTRKEPPGSDVSLNTDVLPGVFEGRNTRGFVKRTKEGFGLVML